MFDLKESFVTPNVYVCMRAQKDSFGAQNLPLAWTMGCSNRNCKKAGWIILATSRALATISTVYGVWYSQGETSRFPENAAFPFYFTEFPLELQSPSKSFEWNARSSPENTFPGLFYEPWNLVLRVLHSVYCLWVLHWSKYGTSAVSISFDCSEFNVFRRHSVGRVFCDRIA